MNPSGQKSRSVSNARAVGDAASSPACRAGADLAGADLAGADLPLGARLESAVAHLASVVSDLEPSLLSGSDATALYRTFAGIDRLSLAGRTLLAPRIEASGIWRDSGHRDGSSFLAAIEGVSAGYAKHTLMAGQRLDQLPSTEDAVRRGDLSAPKLAELTGAGALDPQVESELLQGAADGTLQEVKERCRRARATSAAKDHRATVRRIHKARYFNSWTDAEGAFCYQGKDTADRGAQILTHIGHVATRLRQGRRAADEAEPVEEEPERAMRADAFYALVTQQQVDPGEGLGARWAAPTAATPDDDGLGRSGGIRVGDLPGSSKGDLSRPPPEALTIIDRPPTCSVVVRVDLDVLLRGSTHPGEICEIDNQGPIPPAMARDMANDSFLRFVFHEAGDIRSVSHFGRTINKSLRTALVYRDRTCVVPGCGVSYGLEIDHVIPFAEGGPTELENLALLCHHHHFLKTFEGWSLRKVGLSKSGSPVWEFEAQPQFGQEPDLGLDLPGRSLSPSSAAPT